MRTVCLLLLVLPAATPCLARPSPPKLLRSLLVRPKTRRRRNRAAVLERNHFYDEHGKLVFTQWILWGESPVGLTVIGWRLEKGFTSRIGSTLYMNDAGTPQRDEFAHLAFKQRAAIAPHAFLARLPAEKLKRRWRVGHVKRPIPTGYVIARARGTTERMDPRLAEYYAHLRVVTLEFYQGLLQDLLLGFIAGCRTGDQEKSQQAGKKDRKGRALHWPSPFFSIGNRTRDGCSREW